MKKFIALSFALVLAGCASYHNPFTTPTLAAVESSYGAALAVAVGYRDACAQRLIPSNCRTVVPIIQAYGKKAQGSIIVARNFVKNNPNISATSAIMAAQTAVDDFKNVQTQYGVK